MSECSILASASSTQLPPLVISGVGRKRIIDLPAPGKATPGDSRRRRPRPKLLVRARRGEETDTTADSYRTSFPDPSVPLPLGPPPAHPQRVPPLPKPEKCRSDPTGWFDAGNAAVAAVVVAASDLGRARGQTELLNATKPGRNPTSAPFISARYACMGILDLSSTSPPRRAPASPTSTVSPHLHLHLLPPGHWRHGALPAGTN